MSSKIAIVALGGNALARADEPATIANQFRHTRESLGSIVELVREGWKVGLVHGNGPQVGDELARNEIALGEVAPLPLGVLVAGTAGWIGYMIQQSLQNALARAGLEREVVTVITQTLVSESDPALRQPTKPIGHALPEERVRALQTAGVPVGRDARGRWRRMASSPRPLGIAEAPLVRRLIEDGVIVIAAGGGGPPVYRDPVLGLEGVDAVVDKDRAGAMLASALEAEVFLILTDVDGVYRGYGTRGAERIGRLSVGEAEQLLASGALDEGGMRPKLEAAVAFVRGGGGRAVIAHLARGSAAMRGETGTEITRHS